MVEFLVEVYISQDDAGAAAGHAAAARTAAEEIDRAGTPVRFLRSIFVPDDETCFLLYEAASADVARAAAVRAGLSPARVSEAILAQNGGGTESFAPGAKRRLRAVRGPRGDGPDSCLAGFRAFHTRQQEALMMRRTAVATATHAVAVAPASGTVSRSPRTSHSTHSGSIDSDRRAS